MSNFKVHKFGGTSLAEADCFRQVANIVAEDHQLIVVSAVGGTTNLLQSAIWNSERGLDNKTIFEEILQKHGRIIEDLGLHNADEVKELLRRDLDIISKKMETETKTKTHSRLLHEEVLAYGEVWSGTILTSLLTVEHKAQFVNAVDIIFIDKPKKLVTVDWHNSQQAWDSMIVQSSATHIVITGFIARNKHDELTTLGRNGSDFSATIIASLAGRESLTIWTDVDGVYSADPKRVNKAFVLDKISYQEILEFSYFGAKVLHSQAIAPAVDNNIKIIVRNTFNLSAKGTTISVETESDENFIRGVSSIDDIALINIEGAGLSGTKGISARLFTALSDAHISVILITQASSEHSICIAIEEDDSELALAAIEREFTAELDVKVMDPVRVDKQTAIIAAVGESMVGKVGIAERFAHALAQANINIKALAQGSSERNISAVIHRDDINKALRVVHSGFYLSRKTLSIGLIGPGLIGHEMLAQIAQARENLYEKFNVNLLVRGVLNSREMLLSEASISEKIWCDSKAKQTSNIDSFIDHIVADDVPHAVILDCSASDKVASYYPQFFQSALHVVTPNKKANSASYDFYTDLKRLSKVKQRHYFYETTVCAGLPVIKTLQDMLQSGDEVTKIEGIVSGTLAFIFNELKTGEPFSSIVLAAKEKGFTEPDPRDDLAGMDVARKMVVLAREIGYEVELNDVNVHNLVPESLRECSLDEFLAELPNHDTEMEAYLQTLVGDGNSACYVGMIDSEGNIDVKIASYPGNHPFSQLRGTDNILSFYTRRYCTQPLVVQGPGAGAEVTAAGVFADLLRLAATLD